MTTPTSPIAAVKLLPCAHCGSEANIHKRKTVMVCCSKCTASTFQVLDEKESAITAWNRRASIELPAAVKLLREALTKAEYAIKGREHTGFIADAMLITASIEQPTSEAVWVAPNVLAGVLAGRSEIGVFGCIQTSDRSIALYIVPPTLPPAKEAILQAMVDQAEELGLYNDVVSAGITPEYKATQKIKNMDARTMLDAVADAPVALANFGPNGPAHWSSSGAPVDERAANVIAWLLLDQGFREPDDFEDFERVVIASEITEEELARFKKDGRATALSIAVFQQSNSSINHEALDIAFDLVNEEAHRIHETYKGYKPDRHAAIDADVATVTAARAALQQPGQADKEDLYNELIFAVHRKFPDESRHQTALRYIRDAEAWKIESSKSSSPKGKS